MNLGSKRTFWSGKKVLVTGHSGFKGGWLCLLLSELGAEVVGLSLPSPAWEWGTKVAQHQQLPDFRFDISQLDELKNLVRETKPQIVFHLAAQPLVRESYLRPIETFATNALGTANLLEAVCRSDSCKVAVAITTDKVYENHESFWGYRESDPLGGHDPYSASKACAEIIIDSYRKSFTPSLAKDLRIASVRSGNVFGGGDFSADRLMPDVAKALFHKQMLQIRYPEAIRPWLFVLEPLWGYLEVARQCWQSPDFACAWNFGPDISQSVSVRKFIELIGDSWGTTVPLKEVEAGLHETTRLLLDSSKANRLLEWYPQLSIDTAISWTVEWYKAFQYQNEHAALELANQQIKDYLRLVTCNLEIAH